MMKDPIDLLSRLFNMLIGLTFLVVFLLVGVLFIDSNPDWIASFSKKSVEESPELVAASDVADGIHVPTGLLDGPGLELVVRHCTGCHSAKLIMQNSATADGWRGTIRWMQETQGLWELGENEEVIIGYLARFYAPVEEGRRRNLMVEDWYTLE